MIHLYTFWITLLRAIQKRNLIHTVKGILQNLEHCTVHGRRLSLLEEGMGEQLGADSKAIHGPVLWKALMPASLKNGAGNGVTSQKDRRTCWTNTEHSHQICSVLVDRSLYQITETNDAHIKNHQCARMDVDLLVAVLALKMLSL